MNSGRFITKSDFTDPYIKDILSKVDIIKRGGAVYATDYHYKQAIKNEENLRRKKISPFVSELFDKHGIECIVDEIDVHKEIVSYAGNRYIVVDFMYDNPYGKMVVFKKIWGFLR